MRIVIFGASAVGGVLAVRLALAGADVAVVARGPHLDAIRSSGLRFTSADEDLTVEFAATEDASALGRADLVVSTLKAHALPSAATALAGLLAPGGRLVVAANGIPWWFFYGFGGPHDGRRLLLLDPDDALWREVGPERVLGCVVYMRAEVVAPGHVHWFGGGQFVLGEPTGVMTAELAAAASCFERAGFAVEATDRIRDAVWDKLQGNAASNPISVLIGGTMTDLVGDAALAEIVSRVMAEVHAVGSAFGAHFAKNVPERVNAMRGFGSFKTSMLQDFERGRSLETDAILGSVVELGRLAGVGTPTLDVLLALIRAKARLAGLPS